MKQKITLAYGTDKKTMEIDEEALAAPLVKPRPAAGASKDARQQLVEALASPVERPRLRDMVGGKTVAFVVSDEFRAGLHRLILDVMMEEIAAGKPGHVTVLCATGTHDPAIYTPNIRKWAMEASEKHGQPIDFIGHDCDDPKLVEIGTTSRGTMVKVEPTWLAAQVRVFGHEAKHHYMAGYSSVAKQVIPGVAGRRTVEQNHKLALDDDSCVGQYPLHADPARRRNPFSEDALEALHMASAKTLGADGKVIDRPCETFLLDMISDKYPDRDDVFFARAGHPDKVTTLITGAADEQGEIQVPKVQYVVISPGGPPASTALYGVQNCFDLALLGAIKLGGEALVIGPCNGRPGMEPDVKGLAPDKKSKALFWDNLVRLQDRTIEQAYKEIADHFELYMWKTWRVLRMFKRDGIRMWVHSELPAATLEQGGFRHCADPQSWIDERVARKDGKFLFIDNGNKLFLRGV